MPTDPNIILQGAQPPPQYGPTPQQLMSMQELSLRMRQFQQQQQGVNTLRELYSDPTNLGPGGTLNPKAVQRLFQTSPELGIKYQGYASQQQLRETQMQGSRAEIVQKAGKEFGELSGKARILYDDLVGQGIPDVQARQRVQERVYGPGLSALAPLMSPEQFQAIPRQFDPAMAGAVAQTFPQAQTAAREKRADDRAERGESRALRLQAMNEANSAVWTGVGPDKKPVTWQNTPDGPVSPDDHIAVDLTGVTGRHKIGNTPGFSPDSPEADTTADAIANYRQAPLSGYALRAPGAQEIMAKVMTKNPDYQATRYPEVAKAMRDFGTGKQGDTTRSLNVAIDHLDSLHELVGALKNGDVAVVNRVANVLKSELNLSTAPTTFEAARSIIGSEVAKAVVGGASALGDREEARKPIDKANSPEILNDVIGEYKRLMAGQLHGLERQYTEATGFGPDSKFAYRKKLDARTIAELERATTPNAPQSGGRPGNPATAPIPPLNPATSAQPTGAGTNGIVPAGAAGQRVQSAPIAVGDSIAEGVGSAGKFGGKYSKQDGDRGNTAYDAVWGRSTGQVLSTIKAADPGRYSGQTVYLSSGASNSPTDLKPVSEQISRLKDMGANVVLMGVGSGVKNYESVNKQLGEIAGQAGVPFAGEPAGTEGGRVHPRNYADTVKQLQGIAPAAAQGQQITITPQMTDADKRKAWGEAQPGTTFRFPDGSVALKR